jgi:Cysteine rich repeat
MKKNLQATLTFCLCVVAGNVHAQTEVAKKAQERLSAAVEKLQTACGDDLKKYCSTVTPGEGRLLFCMMAHEDKISAKCDYALYSAARNLDRAIDYVERPLTPVGLLSRSTARMCLKVAAV